MRIIIRILMRMGRKNLYIPDEFESTIEKFEKRLQRRGQSLSEFFLQSVRNAVPKLTRGPIERETPRRVPVGATCAIAVDAEWRHSSAVNALVGAPDNPTARAKDSSLIFAKVIGIDDPFGLWIELNSERKRIPGQPVLQFAIPWHVVIGICADPADVDNFEYEKYYGFDVTTNRE